jgi:aldose 1-epimerase
MIKETLFGKLGDGQDVFLYCLKNDVGSQVNIINYGAIVTHLYIKDKKNRIADVVLGYDSLEEYLIDKAYLGGIVGRYANRIAKGQFQLKNKKYFLSVNDGKNHLHGGLKGFSKVLWEAEPYENPAGSSLKLTYESQDGEEGYPGTIILKVVYTLTKNHELVIHYEGTTDRTTILNPSHHSYFNLSGDLNTTILDHYLSINADYITPIARDLIPTGNFAAVKDTAFDFLKPNPIDQHINDKDQQLIYGKGFDHNWVINNYHKGSIQRVATLYDPKSGRLMEVLTDQPGLQFYSGNFLNGSFKGKDGIVYQCRSALCLETQHFPDSPNKSHFPSVVLEPNETYRQTTIYKFSAG